MHIPQIPLTLWEDDVFEKAQIQVHLARLDLIHPDFGGNKFFKLRHNIAEMGRQGKDKLLTFGGAYSNHIWATAALGHHLGFQTIGIIRGEETLPLNPVLAQAKEWGMQIQYVNRTDYRTLKAGKLVVASNVYVVPEGGSNEWAVMGCAEILQSLALPAYQYAMVACGTGATLAGLIAGEQDTQCVGVAVLKGGDFLHDEVKRLLPCLPVQARWGIWTDYHFGGYAKTTPELRTFCHDFAQKYFKLDVVYVGKLLYALKDQASKGFFKPASTVVALVTQRQQEV